MFPAPFPAAGGPRSLWVTYAKCTGKAALVGERRAQIEVGGVAGGAAGKDRRERCHPRGRSASWVDGPLAEQSVWEEDALVGLWAAGVPRAEGEKDATERCGGRERARGWGELGAGAQGASGEEGRVQVPEAREAQESGSETWGAVLSGFRRREGRGPWVWTIPSRGLAEMAGGRLAERGCEKGGLRFAKQQQRIYWGRQ